MATSTARCQTAEAAISFDFEGASQSQCVIEGERSFGILITPEHAPPINPSPWYALRYEAKGSAPVTVTLHYSGAKHRYSPKLDDTAGGQVGVELEQEGEIARLLLPAGSGTISGQPLRTSQYCDRLLDTLAAGPEARRIVLGRSQDSRAVEAVRFGSPDAPKLIVLLGRAHPPEVTGTYAFDPFVEAVEQRLRDEPSLAAQFQVLAVPLLNPDGVALGHWRANHGGVDLNRDWGKFAQPETRAVGDWLAGLPPHIRPVAMLDFHSTQRNLFYVQGEEASEEQEQFLANWLVGKETRFPGYAFTLERSNANPGSGTSKNWFHAAYAIPAYTYEVADNADEEATRRAAAQLGSDFIDALVKMGNVQTGTTP
ncbi:MAG: M14 family metallopeptidase [Pontixanthobacter sp.]